MSTKFHELVTLGTFTAKLAFSEYCLIKQYLIESVERGTDNNQNKKHVHRVCVNHQESKNECKNN